MAPNDREDPHGPGGEQRPASAGPTEGLGGRVLRARMPAWLAAVLVLATLITFSVVLLTRDSVDLGPAVDGARDARVSLTICNEIVDRREINPRTAELDFENALKDLGARSADVVIDRVDCGPSATAPQQPR